MAALERFLLAFAAFVDRGNLRLGHGVSFLVLALVLLQFFVVVLRFVFGVGFIALQEAVWYLHGLIFMLGAGYTLLLNEHVRVDVFYRRASARFKALVDFSGALLFLLPVSIATLLLSFGYVRDSWFNFTIGKWVLEGSTELSGLPLVFLLKTVIWLFAITLGLQGLSLGIKAGLYLRGTLPDYPLPPAAFTKDRVFLPKSSEAV